MATNTTNYGWTKPSYEDEADIEVINDTIDNIDAQVKTNENNISSLDTEIDTVANLGAKNLFDITADPTNFNASSTVDLSTGAVSVTSSGAWARSSIPVLLPAGNYAFSTTVSLPSGSCRIQFNTAADGSGSGIGTPALNPTESGNYTSSIALSEDKSFYILLYNNPTANSDTRTVIYSKLMLRPASISDSTYQPYAMSNAELTAAIQALQAQLANQ